MNRHYPKLDIEHAGEEVRARESMFSTVIAPGLAVPHARIAGLPFPLVAVASTPAGVSASAGDSKIYDENEIEIITGGIYRSLHYIIKYRGYYVEIQGRTLFEEGWSEIDHDIVYPYNKDDEMLKDFSKLLNRLSGMADEMSSYFSRMKEERGNNIF